MTNVLLVNSCARPNSRTYALARKAAGFINIGYKIINLYNEDLKPLDYYNLSKRSGYIQQDDLR